MRRSPGRADQLSLFDDDQHAGPTFSPVYLLWEAGALVPLRVTKALNLCGLYGPEVDIACLAREPEVDEWEAGTRYPSWAQLVALANLTGFDPAWFFKLTTQDDYRLTSPVFLCGPRSSQVIVEDGVEHVLAYPVDIVRATVGA